MKQFIVLFMAPMSAIEEWMKTPEAERKAGEDKMKAEWDAWTAAHASMIKESRAVGATKRVTPSGVADAKNDIMIYSIIEGESQEAVAKLFEGHPHFTIPGASIDISAIRAL